MTVGARGRYHVGLWSVKARRFSDIKVRTMAHRIRFPKVAPGVEEAMVGVWRKNEGEAVAKGEALVELITDKATFDLEADASGVLLKVAAPEKSAVPVGYVLAVVGEAGETPPAVDDENREIMERHAAKSAPAQWAAPSGGAAKGGGVKATPSARRLARQEGVELGDVAAHCGKTVVRDEDVRAYLER